MSMMDERSHLICPSCGYIQDEDVFDLIEGDSMEDSFDHMCDECGEYFNVEFILVPKVREKILYLN